ncbi:hypothetical protein FHY55_13100 [Oceanicola sp. D3]|uniref:hypothetical protein n=1 Tax=Oceanicola sp. D3 TaxID=2587163 RepID=UPI00112170F8|nr:hypothetical protein [Oceanicola sp. D3]QDC10127.1 hypothetical protein FHY55_13100 [Oceanicola sp. D3]
MTTERGQETCNCETVNFFRCDLPAEYHDALSLRAMVNGQPTEMLPRGETYRFPNTLGNTTAAIDLVGSGTSQTTYYPQIDDGTPLTPEDLQMYVGARDIGQRALEDPARQALQDMIASPATPETMRIQYRTRLRQMDEEDRQRAAARWEQEGGNGEGVFLLALSRTPIGDGEVNPDTLDPVTLVALTDELGEAFGVFWDDLHSVYYSMGGAVGRALVGQAHKFETTFRNVNDLMGRNLSMADQVRMRRIFLREIFSARIGRVYTHRGQKLISFRGPAGNRVFLRRTSFPANSMTVLNANTAAGQNAAAIRSAAGNTFRGTGGFFLIVGGVIEVVHWLTLPESERFLADLCVNLGLMVAIGVFSGVAATAAVVLGLAAAGMAAPVVVTGLAIGAVALGIGLAVSWALDATGIRESLQTAARRFFDSLAAFTQQLFPPRSQTFYDPDAHPIQNMGLVEGIEYFNNAGEDEQQYIMDRMFGLE